MATFLECLFLIFTAEVPVFLVGQVIEPFCLAQSSGNITGTCVQSLLGQTPSTYLGSVDPSSSGTVSLTLANFGFSRIFRNGRDHDSSEKSKLCTSRGNTAARL